MAKVERRSGSEVLRDKRARAVAEVGADGNVNTKALLSVLFGAAFIAAFNENIINVGLMDIMAEFSIDSITAQWLVTGYMMVTAIVVLMLAGIAFVRPLGKAQRISLDVASLALAAAGLTCFIFGLINLTSNLVLALALLVLGAGLIAVFAVRQGRLEHPLLNLEPLHTARFSIACVLVVVSMMTTFSMSVLLPLYFEGAMGYTAFMAGVLVLMPILVNAGTALLGGRIMDAKGEWPLLPGGFLLITAGMAGVAVLAGAIQVVPVVVAACVVYAGVGFVMSPSQTAGLKQLPRELNAHGVALINVFIQVAASAGPSLYMGILSSSEATSLASGASAAASVADGFAASALVATIIGAIGLVTSLVYARMVANAAPHADAAHAQAPRGLDLASVMKRDVFTIRADQTVAEAVQAMLDHHTSGLPVVDESGHVVGFISDGDIMKSLADAGQPVIDLTYSLSVFADDVRFDMRLAHLMNANVMEVATDRVVSVDVGTPIERVCTVLGEKRIKKLPVLDGGRLVGTISRSDVNRSLMAAFLQAA